MTATAQTPDMTDAQVDAYDLYEDGWVAMGGDPGLIPRGWDGHTLLLEVWRDGVQCLLRIAPDGSIRVERQAVSS